MSSPMQPVVKIGHRHHPLDTKKYGHPRLALYYANRHAFVAPGLYLWTGNRQVRVLPLRRRTAPGAREAK